MDLIGPIKITNIRGRKYILVILYYFSKYTCVLFQRKKIEAFDQFKTLCIELESKKFESMSSIMKIKSDHGK